MSDAFWTAFWLSFGPGIPLTLNFAFNVYNERRKRHEQKDNTLLLAGKAEEVKVTLASARVGTDNKLDEIHTLVNDRLEKAMKKIEALQAAWEASQAEVAVLHSERGERRSSDAVRRRTAVKRKRLNGK